MSAFSKYQKAKTAYGLLSNIIRIIEKDARHMRMGQWIMDPDNLLEAERPECGTVGCIGGWIDTITERRNYRNAQKTLGFLRMSPLTESGDYSPEYLEEDRAIEGLMFGELCSASGQGTKKHARAVIKVIRKFQKTHKARLLKTKVTIGGQL
jgi:hypothetical protein